VSTPRSTSAAPGRLLGLTLVLGLSGLALGAPAALAAPPPNDAAASPGAFAPYTARNGRPHDLQAIAELVEATPDAGVPACLGPGSFARTVWYAIPAAEAPQALTVEASGRTLDVVDLAAFVQPEGATSAATAQPNACSGLGAGGADAAEEPTSAVSLHVPARRSVLIEVGRRGPRRSADDERVVLSLDARPLNVPPNAPAGDIALPTTPGARVPGPTFMDLAGSTLTEEDPAEPPCPSLGSVWRRVVPGRSGTRLISVGGAGVSTLTVFSGTRPTSGNALDCVDRAGPGALQVLVPARARKPLWIRVGADGPPEDSAATLLVEPGAGQKVVDGGRGGFDPTTGGPGGGLPALCSRADAEHARVAGPAITGRAKPRNRRRNIGVTVGVRGALLCDVDLQLVGPHGAVYAETRAARLRPRSVVRLTRVRKLVRGSYRLRVTAISKLGERVSVRTRLTGKLR
jgi:hypothetical protein